MATPTAAAPRPVSPFDAAFEAFAHMRRQLFPFRLEVWAALGLLAFLEQCGRSFRGGGGGSSGWRHHASAPGGMPADLSEVVAWLQRAADWVSAHTALVVVGGLSGLAVIAAITAVVLWFNARGVFMYADDVATGRADVVRPWHQHAAAASSYFGWSLGLSLAGLFLVLFAGVVIVAGALSFVRRGQEGGPWLGIAGMAPVLGFLLLGLLALGLAAMALRDFVAPLQLATGLPCGAAARVLETLVLEHPGAFVLYLVVKLVVVVGSAIIIAILGCLTCCIGFIPVVMQIVFQPLFYFERAISILLLRQLGYDVAARLTA